MQGINDLGDERALHVAQQKPARKLVEDAIAQEAVCQCREAAARYARDGIDPIEHAAAACLALDGRIAKSFQDAERERSGARTAAGECEEQQRLWVAAHDAFERGL